MCAQAAHASTPRRSLDFRRSFSSSRARAARNRARNQASSPTRSSRISRVVPDFCLRSSGLRCIWTISSNRNYAPISSSVASSRSRLHHIKRIAWTSTEDCRRSNDTVVDREPRQRRRLSHCRPGRPDRGGHGRPASPLVSADTSTFRSYPLDEFERDLDEVMGPGTGRRIASKFRYFATHRDDADAILAAPYSRTAELEGFVPNVGRGMDSKAATNLSRRRCIDRNPLDGRPSSRHGTTDQLLGKP
jgi:hypothetical protein